MKLPVYKTFEEKSHYFQEEKINTPDQFNVVYDRLRIDAEHLIFRGVKEAKYKNYTSAQREWKTNRLSHQIDYLSFIKRVLDNIKQNKILRDYYRALGVIPNDLLYLSFLQHYGAPTPMLDFTHGLDIALFFSYDGVIQNDTGYGIGDYVSLYYIDLRECGNELSNMIDLYQKFSERIESILKTFRTENPNVNIDDSVISEISEFVRWDTQSGFSNVDIGLYDWSFTSPRLTLNMSGQTLVWANLNMIAQRGCFINYNGNRDPLEVFLSNHRNLPKMHCIDIPKSFEMFVSAKINKNREDVYPQEEDLAKNSYYDYLKAF